MYVEFMKNFPFADSNEQMLVRLILAFWAQKRWIPTYLTWFRSGSWKIFLSPIRASLSLLGSFWPHERKNFWFLLSRHDVRRVHENFPLADSNEQMAVRLILALWAQKRLIPNF